MGKNRQRSNASNKANNSSGDSSNNNKRKIEVSLSEEDSTIVWRWLYSERQGLLWVISCAFLGSLLGFGIGTGHLTGSVGGPVSAWRVALGGRIRSTHVYRYTQGVHIWNALYDTVMQRQPQQQDDSNLQQDPSHPRIFAILREAIVREKGGYVHPDLGFLTPAPSGAARGIGMVRKGYHICQTRCLPGTASEKEALKDVENPDFAGIAEEPIYRQEEVLIKLPLAYQMARPGALATLTALIPPDILSKAPLDDLDDAAILVLYLAHERGLSRASKWLPYIASLPKEPSCGYNAKLRPFYLDAIAALSDELELEVQGWPTELNKAARYADRIASALARDYGAFLTTPDGMTVTENLRWALCQVASRATAGVEKYGSLRMLPLLDQINHDATGGGFIELTGAERLEDGDFLSAAERDSGMFVIRSLRHGRRRALKVGQELTVNYNIPHYAPLDWFISLGFVPSERWGPWIKVDPVLPRVRKDGPFNAEEESNNNEWINMIK
jgi:hypothetical protein